MPRLSPCEHAFVSIKGRDYLWFRKALERGGLATVRSTLVGLPPLTLDDALSVVLLICEREPENAERAAVRWLRKLLERPGVTLAELVRRSTPVSCSSRMPTAQRHRCGGSRVGSSARDRLALSAAGRPPRQR